jgi:hypothetical protein
VGSNPIVSTKRVLTRSFVGQANYWLKPVHRSIS